MDGPSGTGKGTVCQRLAAWLGWHYLDSGALYRAVGHVASQRGVPLDDARKLAELAATLDLRFESKAGSAGEPSVFLDGADVAPMLRTEEAGRAASQVAALPQVRAALLNRQRTFRQVPGLIADGRDMGTVVFPDARLKIFLTASAEERARRRYNQLKQKGIDVSLRALFRDISERDERDRTRAVSPLIPALGAVVMDTTAMGIEAVYETARKLIIEKGLYQQQHAGS